MNKPTKREVSSIFNSLTCVVKALEGERTTIDLRDESCVTGKILFVDGYMNVDMENCIYYNSRGKAYPFDTFFVKKRSIRYVHIPKGLSATELANKQFAALRNEKSRGRKPQTGASRFKKKRAERYQQEILQEMASTSK